MNSILNQVTKGSVIIYSGGGGGGGLEDFGCVPRKLTGCPHKALQYSHWSPPPFLIGS